MEEQHDRLRLSQETAREARTLALEGADRTVFYLPSMMSVGGRPRTEHIERRVLDLDWLVADGTVNGILEEALNLP